jgi:ABC-2 type transport system ATP-binding protein
MSSKVSVRDLQKQYGGVPAARGVSFEIQDGEIFGLIGPNGAGKTTTLECVIGLREPDSGHIEVCGIDARRRLREVKQKIGAALQTTALQDKITPREALALFGAFYPNRATPGELLDRFALTDKADAAFDTLSDGQRQRLALALAFVNRPELLCLDEPTAGLDPSSRRELHGEIARMKRDGHTVLLTTHYIDEAEHLCDRVAVIDHGRIIAMGTARELIASSRARQSVFVATVQPIGGDLLAGLSGVEELSCEATTARFLTTDVNRAVAELMSRLNAHGIEMVELRVQKATLEDVFLELTKGPGAGDRWPGSAGGPSEARSRQARASGGGTPRALDNDARGSGTSD